MPTASATTSRTSPLNKGAKSSSPSPPNLTNPQPRSQRRTRLVRRRGRRAGGVESEDEIERETLSDETDSEEDASSLEDDSASETEPESESVVSAASHPKGVARIDTPSTTQSPAPGDLGLPATVNGFHDDAVKEASVDGGSGATAVAVAVPAAAFLSSGVDWAEMNGDELPVVEFESLQVGGLDSLPASNPNREASDFANEEEGQSGQVHQDEEGGAEEEEATRSAAVDARRGAHSPNRPRGGRGAAQMARQAYQSRLQNDPSFVPVVGEFWGHDDRLLQKDLRSLSGWWRGRWQGRGRGRGGMAPGRGMGYRGRGRGGYVGGGPFLVPAPDGSSEQAPVEENVPPVERTWGHDGYEEMKEREERRRAFDQDRASRGQNKRGGGASGRGGRGGYSRRGAFSPAPSNGSASVGAGAGARSKAHAHASSDRIWYAKKPEVPWTKQHEGFLHFDASTKSKGGKGPAYRVKLPGVGGNGEVVVGVGARGASTSATRASEVGVPEAQTHAPPESVTDRASNFVVRLPKKRQEEQAKVEVGGGDAPPSQEAFTTVEELVAEPSTAAAEAAPEVAQAVEAPSGAVDSQATAGPSRLPLEAINVVNANAPPDSSEEPEHATLDFGSAAASVQGSSYSNSIPEVFIAPTQISPTSLQNLESERAHISQLPPIQTHFPPPAQPSPTPTFNNSPYAFSAPPLPPGVALDQRGFAYEVASGRPVYLHPHPTPPPPHMPLYNPRPIMPFHPGHMHHHSHSHSAMSAAEYMMAPPPQHTHTPPLNGFIDAATGVPLFSLPRQSSRVEIRAPPGPGETQAQTEGKSGREREKRPSGLSRSTTAEDEGGDVTAAAQEEVAKSAPNGYFSDAVNNPYATSDGLTMPNGIVEAQMPTQQQQQQVIDPAMMGYAPYNPYYYPEHYGYPAYTEYSQPTGQYEPYPSAPIYY